MSAHIDIEAEVRAMLAEIERRSKLVHMSPDQYHDFLTSLMDELNILACASYGDEIDSRKGRM